MNLADSPVVTAAGCGVRPFVDADAARWDEFVAGCPDASFYHRIGWREIMQDVLRHRAHYLLAERGASIVGVLPLVEVRSRLFGHSLVSLPFAAHAGVASADAEASDRLHDAAVELAARLNVEHLELRNVAPRHADWPTQDLYVTFRRAISADHDANLNAIPRKQRAMVRKAISRGLTAEVDPDTDRFFELFADNVHRHGTPALSRRYFQSLKRIFGTDCETLTVLSPQGRPVSSVLSFYFRDEVLAVYAGDTPEARDLAANDFKYWELMRRAADRGVRVFDYGRSKRGSGQFDFKRNWGFEPAQLHYEYRLLRRDSVPQNNPNNPKYRALIGVWRRLPRPVVDRVGPWIVRNLG